MKVSTTQERVMREAMTSTDNVTNTYKHCVPLKVSLWWHWLIVCYHITRQVTLLVVLRNLDPAWWRMDLVEICILLLFTPKDFRGEPGGGVLSIAVYTGREWITVCSCRLFEDKIVIFFWCNSLVVALRELFVIMCLVWEEYCLFLTKSVLLQTCSLCIAFIL